AELLLNVLGVLDERLQLLLLNLQLPNAISGLLEYATLPALLRALFRERLVAPRLRLAQETYEQRILRDCLQCRGYPILPARARVCGKAVREHCRLVGLG